MCVFVADGDGVMSKAGEMLELAAHLFKGELTKKLSVVTPKNNAVGLALTVSLYIAQPKVISMYEDTDEGYNLTIQQTGDGKVMAKY